MPEGLRLFRGNLHKGHDLPNACPGAEGLGTRTGAAANGAAAPRLAAFGRCITVARKRHAAGARICQEFRGVLPRGARPEIATEVPRPTKHRAPRPRPWPPLLPALAWAGLNHGAAWMLQKTIRSEPLRGGLMRFVGAGNGTLLPWESKIGRYMSGTDSCISGLFR